jgi:ribosomal protein L32
MGKVRSCGKKRRYRSRGQAMSHSRRLQRMYGSLPSQATVYLCKYCGGYHVGHTMPSLRGRS